MTESFLRLLPEQASTVAARVDALYFFLVGVSAFFALSIALTLIVFAVRFRRRSEDEVPEAIHGSLVLEILWTAVPLGLVMVMFVWGTSLYFTLARPPAGALHLYAVGKQWMWKFQHPDGRREINELHVPVGQPIVLAMGSEDVIHSFYVPAFRVKQDVVPGRYTTVWFEATRPGTYHLFCAEYCGTQHSGMIGSVTVMEPAGYQQWLSGGPVGPSMVATGEKLFGDLGCATCHRPDGKGRGPSLAGVFGKSVRLRSGQLVTADESYLRESIVNPAAKILAGFEPVMPTFQGLVTEEQIAQLIAYIKSLQKTESS